MTTVAAEWFRRPPLIDGDAVYVQAGASVRVGSSRRSKAAVIAHALDRRGIDAGDHVVMVGDRDHDVQGARQNGLDCIGVTWGFGSPEELAAAGAAALADTPARVVEAVPATYRGSAR